jgi:hypothetical protein
VFQRRAEGQAPGGNAWMGLREINLDGGFKFRSEHPQRVP